MNSQNTLYYVHFRIFAGPYNNYLAARKHSTEEIIPPQQMLCLCVTNTPIRLTNSYTFHAHKQCRFNNTKKTHNPTRTAHMHVYVLWPVEPQTKNATPIVVNWFARMDAVIMYMIHMQNGCFNDFFSPSDCVFNSNKFHRQGSAHSAALCRGSDAKCAQQSLHKLHDQYERTIKISPNRLYTEY